MNSTVQIENVRKLTDKGLSIPINRYRSTLQMNLTKGKLIEMFSE